MNRISNALRDLAAAQARAQTDMRGPKNQPAAKGIPEPPPDDFGEVLVAAMESSMDDLARGETVPLALARRPVDAEILLVESDPEDAELILGALADAGMGEASFLVSSGRRALDYLGRRSPYPHVSRPSLVLLDLALPDIAGLDVLSRMKACHATATIPVVVLAGIVRESDIARAYALGAASYVPKDDGLGKLTNNLALLVFYWFQVARLPGARPGP